MIITKRHKFKRHNNCWAPLKSQLIDMYAVPLSCPRIFIATPRPSDLHLLMWINSWIVNIWIYFAGTFTYKQLNLKITLTVPKSNLDRSKNNFDIIYFRRINCLICDNHQKSLVKAELHDSFPEQERHFRWENSVFWSERSFSRLQWKILWQYRSERFHFRKVHKSCKKTQVNSTNS